MNDELTLFQSAGDRLESGADRGVLRVVRLLPRHLDDPVGEPRHGRRSLDEADGVAGLDGGGAAVSPPPAECSSVKFKISICVSAS